MNPLVGILAGQVFIGVTSSRKHKHLYQAARQAADKTGKPLLVVGGPFGSGYLRRRFNLKSHGFGDVCTDIDPISCKGAPHLEVADIRRLPFPSKSFWAVFIGHVLDKLPIEERGAATA